ncbi:MAG: DUF1573 domain-containing protein [Dehalococcoidia bacterium]|nr:DUF1573 domain-containing protein [Dehalococcoidia bacterium]
MSRRFRASLVIAPLALTLILVAAACAEQPPATGAGQGGSGARISVDSDTVDFGQVPLDKEVTHSFRIKNSGTGTLNLANVSIKVVQGC